MLPFRDRPDAGNKLIPLLSDLEIDVGNMVVVAIPNGGVPVAIPIARHFNKPLYVLIARKVQFPWTTEAGFGAVIADGTTIFNDAAVRQNHLSKDIIHAQVQRALQEVQQREILFQKFSVFENLDGMEIILIDDGLASGITTRAAIESLQKRGAQKVFVAVPTAQMDSARDIERLASNEPPFYVEVVCPDIKSGWPFAVAQAYVRWYDEESDHILQELEQYSQPFAGERKDETP
ncbi:MAG TPA: phosphoribosyltransferase family protein [Candidatus Lokiarchaeia archaeon]|nr:phosphoribosyltransferase family protein [Candidatus Lokiarchaeia archaeon]